MLQRHFNGTSARIGVGANRAAVAAPFLKRHKRLCSEQIGGSFLDSSTIQVVILDDGMQVKFFDHFPTPFLLTI